MGTPTPLGLSPQPQGLPSSPSPSGLDLVIGIIAIAFGLAMAALRALAWSHWVMSAETTGYAAGGALLPAIVAYLIAGRRPAAHFRRFGLAFGAMSLLLVLISGRSEVNVKQHVADLAREAAGTKTETGLGSDETDALVRNMMRDILDDRKAFDRDSAPFAATLAKLYSLESYSSKEQMQRYLDAVRGSAAVDERYSAQIETIVARTQARVNQSNLSDSDKLDVMKGLQDGIGSSQAFSIRKQLTGIQKEWAGKTEELYKFALANATQIRVEGSHLVIANRKTLNEFRQLQRESLALRDRIRTLNAQLKDEQNKQLQEVGLTRKDLGLPDSNQPAKK